MLKNIRLLLLIYCFLSLVVFAQEQTDKSTAQLIDEYSNSLVVSSVIARLDNVAAVSQAEPNSRLFIIINRHQSELPGRIARALNWTELYLTQDRRINPKTIVLIDGGATSCPKTQIWIAPVNTAPKAEERVYEQTFEDNDVPRKYDEYYFSFDKLYIDIFTDYGRIFVNSLKQFADEVRKKKNATAYVVVYPQYEIRYSKQTDPPDAATKMSRSIRHDLINKYKLAPAKLQIVNGGYRKLRQVELWVLPRGVHPPVATPNVFPKFTRKKRSK